MEQAASRREINKARTRAAILEAARAGFAGKGVAATTMEDIAEAAEVSRATLFNYFTGKGEILDHLAAEMNESFLTRIDTIREAVDAPSDRVRRLLAESGKALAEEGDRWRVVIGYLELGWNEAGLAERMERLTTSFESLLGAGADRGHERRVLAEMIVATYVGMVHNWRLGEDYPIAERLAEMGENFHALLRLRGF